MIFEKTDSKKKIFFSLLSPSDVFALCLQTETRILQGSLLLLLVLAVYDYGCRHADLSPLFRLLWQFQRHRYDRRNLPVLYRWRCPGCFCVYCHFLDHLGCLQIQSIPDYFHLCVQRNLCLFILRCYCLLHLSLFPIQNCMHLHSSRSIVFF